MVNEQQKNIVNSELKSLKLWLKSRDRSRWVYLEIYMPPVFGKEKGNLSIRLPFFNKKYYTKFKGEIRK